MTAAVTARRVVGTLVRNGMIIPEPCRKCGATPTQAHHANGYEGPNALDVEWLCASHHRLAHKQVDHAVARKETGGMTLKEAASLLGLDPATLRQQIHNGSLRATKMGRDWFVTSKEVEKYRKEHRRA